MVTIIIKENNEIALSDGRNIIIKSGLLFAAEPVKENVNPYAVKIKLRSPKERLAYLDGYAAGYYSAAKSRASDEVKASVIVENNRACERVRQEIKGKK